MPSRIPEKIEKEIEEKGGLEKLIAAIPGKERIESYAKIFSALGDPTRLRILCFLAKQRSCVCLIREIVNLSYSKLSYHLSVMKNANLISGEKMGNYIIYEVTSLGRKYASEICGGD